MTAACRMCPTWLSFRRSSSGATLVGFAGSIAHKADVGGTNPGSTSANATEIFQEGLLLPPVKIYSRGVYNDDLERLILANSRQPELVRGDMHAQMAATQMGVVAHSGDLRAVRRHGDHGGVRGAARRRRRRIARRDQGAAGRRSLRRRFHGQRRRRARPAGALCRHGARRRTATSPSISPRATARPRGRSICGRRWSRPACSIR